MAHDVSQKHVNLHISDADKRRIKDSLLLIVVFIIGLLGSCYILHIALSKSSSSSSTGYHDVRTGHGESAEMIYLTER